MQLAILAQIIAPRFQIRRTVRRGSAPAAGYAPRQRLPSQQRPERGSKQLPRLMDGFPPI